MDASVRSRLSRSDRMEQTLGAAHLETIGMLAAKGALWTEMGMQDRALPLLEQTLSTRLERLRSDHPFVGLNHMDLGDALRKQGDTEGALAHFEKAVTIISNGYGSTHPRLAAVLPNPMRSASSSTTF